MAGIFEQVVSGKGRAVDSEIGQILADDDLQFGLEHIKHVPKAENLDDGEEKEVEKKLPPHETR